MSFEAVPCVFKSRDDTGKDEPMIGLLIRPSGQQTTASSTSSNGASTAIQSATTVIPIAPMNSINGQLNSNTSAQIQILPSTSIPNAAPKILRPIGMGSIDRATLLAATRATNPAAILRPIATTSSSSLMPLSVLKNNDKSVTKNVAPKTTTSKRQTSKKATKEKLTTPIIHNFCKDLPTSDNVFGANKEIEANSTRLQPKQPECNFNAPTPITPIANQERVNDYKEPYNNTPSTSNAQSTMNESALEDLNSIEMNQLLANTSTINTEDYLDQSLNGNIDFYVGHPSTSTPNTSNPGQFNYPAPKQHPSHSRNMRSPTASVSHHYQQNGHSIPPNMHYANYYGPPTHQMMPHHSQAQPLLQPMHPNDQNVHHSHYRPGTSYGYNNQQPDHRRMVLTNGMHPSGSNQLSTSPDSGIQSIDGSPPSTFTPPMVSPFMVQATNYDHHAEQITYPHQLNHCPPSSSSALSNPVVSVNSIAVNEEDDDDDFSDMPTLVRVDQMDTSDLTDRPESSATRPDMNTSVLSNNSFSRSNSRASTSMTNKADDESGIIAITPGMDLAEIAERLGSIMDPEKLKQFTSIIQSKVSDSRRLDNEKPEVSIEIPFPASDPPSSFKSPAKSTKSAKNKTSKICHKNELNVKSTNKSSKVAKVADQVKPSTKRRQQQEQENDVAMKNERLRIYRQKVEQKLKAKLAQLIVQIGTEFENLHLKFGPCYKFPLPWRSLNWSEVDKRLAKRNLKRKLEEPADESPKKPRLDECEILESKGDLSKKNRGRPTQKHSQLEISPKSRLVRKAQPSSEVSASLKVPEDDKSKSPVVQRRRRSQNKNDFIKIRSNVLIDTPPRLPEANKCNCTLSTPCINLNCIHRAALEECTQATCQWHDQCKNRRMGNNEAIHQLQIFDTQKCGKGVRSAVEIYPGQFICEFAGEVVKHQNYQLRTLMRSEDMPRFGIHLTNNFVVDATQRGNIARFINHSCDPNCEMQKWIVNGYYRLGIFAKKKIEEGEELTYNYSMFVNMEPAQKCECGSTNCNGVIPSQSVTTSSICQEPQQLDEHQLSLVRETRVLLPRNLKKFNRGIPSRSMQLCKKYPELASLLIGIYENTIQHAEKKERVTRRRITQLCMSMRVIMNMSHKSADILIERFDGLVKSWISSLYPTYERRVIDALKSHYIHTKKTRDIERSCPRLAKETIRSFTEDRKRAFHTTSKRENHRVLSAEADLTYMDSGCQIGSYNPDERVVFSSKNEEADSVRCICGIMEDDGKMILCDRCNYWMHADCVDDEASSGDEFECDFCKKGIKHTQPVDIILKPQPEINFPGCTYYRTLVNSRGLQVRINEAVYVERLINDDYKKILKSMHEECAQPKKRGRKTTVKDQPNTIQTAITKTLYGRRDVRHFRVERLFVSPQGQRFVFGCYYARPHETFCDSTRLFHKNELFWTPMFDTLPLDAVIGRCLILEPVNWIEGRPKMPKYKEEDVFVCEYQIDKNQRTFTKIQSNNHYYLNTAPYAFEKFGKKLELKRNFTPFTLNVPNQKIERGETRERIANAAKELSSNRLNIICKRIVSTKR